MSSSSSALPGSARSHGELPSSAPPAAGRVVRLLGLPVRVGPDAPGRLFWLTQLFVWLWYANVVIVLLLATARVRPAGAAFAWGLTEAGYGMLTTWHLRLLYRRWFAAPPPRDRVAALARRAPAPWIGLACLAGALYWAFVAWGTNAFFAGTPAVALPLPLASVRGLPAAAWVARVTLDAVVLALWSVGYFAAESRAEARAARARALEATAQLEGARFEALRYQVNPHFLFNALNALQALIPEDAERAGRVVGQLAAYLRYTLLPAGAPGGSALGGAPAGSFVPLGDELAALGAYLAVEQVRFEARLDARFEVDPAAEAALVPPLLLQPLVENAVRHGPRPGAPLALRVRAALDGGTLTLAVANTGTLRGPDRPGSPPPAAPGAGAGIGLRNVRARLALAYPGRHAFTLAQEGEWVVARVTVRPAGGAGAG